MKLRPKIGNEGEVAAGGETNATVGGETVTNLNGSESSTLDIRTARRRLGQTNIGSVVPTLETLSVDDDSVETYRQAVQDALLANEDLRQLIPQYEQWVIQCALYEVFSREGQPNVLVVADESGLTAVDTRRGIAKGDSSASGGMHGGQGSIYHSYNSSANGTSTIIKTTRLNGDGAKNDDVKLRFFRDTQAHADLDEVNGIPNVFTAGSIDDLGYLYMVQQEVPGGITLDELIKENGALPPAVATIIGYKVSRIMQQVAARGLVHRDLTPKNIMLCQEGNGWVIDFGLAHSRGRDEQIVSAATVTNQQMGTPGYMMGFPERGAKAASEQYDMKQLAAVLYYLATGHPLLNKTEQNTIITHSTVQGTAALKNVDFGKKIAPLWQDRASVDLAAIIELLLQDDDQMPTGWQDLNANAHVAPQSSTGKSVRVKSLQDLADAALATGTWPTAPEQASTAENAHSIWGETKQDAAKSYGTALQEAFPSLASPVDLIDAQDDGAVPATMEFVEPELVKTVVFDDPTQAAEKELKKRGYLPAIGAILAFAAIAIGSTLLYFKHVGNGKLEQVGNGTSTSKPDDTPEDIKPIIPVKVQQDDTVDPVEPEPPKPKYRAYPGSEDGGTKVEIKKGNGNKYTFYTYGDDQIVYMAPEDSTDRGDLVGVRLMRGKQLIRPIMASESESKPLPDGKSGFTSPKRIDRNLFRIQAGLEPVASSELVEWNIEELNSTLIRISTNLDAEHVLVDLNEGGPSLEFDTAADLDDYLEKEYPSTVASATAESSLE